MSLFKHLNSRTAFPSGSGFGGWKIPDSCYYGKYLYHAKQPVLRNLDLHAQGFKRKKS